MIEIDRKLCDTCGTCVGVCPSDALAIELTALALYPDRCIGCHACVAVCPVEALKVED